MVAALAGCRARSGQTPPSLRLRDSWTLLLAMSASDMACGKLTTVKHRILGGSRQSLTTRAGSKKSYCSTRLPVNEWSMRERERDSGELHSNIHPLAWTARVYGASLCGWWSLAGSFDGMEAGAQFGNATGRVRSRSIRIRKYQRLLRTHVIVEGLRKYYM